ncbi:MAG: PDK repeat-containing protein [Bacteroidetes bacterium]|nr:MAG: PDK repeat-containing protein [Bacteroidota bacterium]
MHAGNKIRLLVCSILLLAGIRYASAQTDDCANLVRKADSLFRIKKYEEACSFYLDAKKCKAHDDYATKQLEAIASVKGCENILEKKYADAMAAGGLYYAKNEWLKAKEHFEMALAIKNGDPFATAKLRTVQTILDGQNRSEMIEADSAFKKGHYEKAYKHYRAIVRSDKTDTASAAAMMLSDSAMRANDPQIDFICGSDYILKVPNVLFPNSERGYDTWLIRYDGPEIDSFQVYIFNRWGEVLFKSNDIHFAWDGKYKNNPVQTDTYVWQIVFRRKENETKKLVGKFNLIR